MPALDHPVLRAVMILLGALGLTQIYLSIGGYVNWPPFGSYPSPGSIPYITVYIASLIILGAIDFLRFRGHVRKEMFQQGVIQQR